ncbi:MAG: DUF1549 domain-containing protein [Verrucomicrobiaceae bacterium]|nr:MAG: DUF1549 domain-containing protein [Verrucomicrobiaceae bacterium]
MTRLFLFTLSAATLLSASPQAVGQAGADSARLKQAALRIDRQVAAFYRSKNLPVPAVTDDATFLRRVFLVAIGRIPTSEEALAFLEIEDADKRAQVVDYLLQSPGYSSHMANWAFDLLRVTDGRVNSSVTNEPYRHWVRKAMADNMPWDEFTRRLLASSGDGWDPETAAVGYYTRDLGMPLDNLSNTMRIFLGERMECAQCHDDPFGTAERHDFYQLAAFTHGQEPLGRELMQPLWMEISRGERANSDEMRAARILWDGIYGMSLGGGGAGRIPLPSDYQYRDGKPGEVVAGRTPFGKTVRMSDKQDENDGRAKLVGWIVERTDQRFPTVIANRMWKRVMGRGLYEPVDDWLAPDKTHHPPMIALLGDLMVELNYDLRSFQHALLLTRTFQFATNPNASIVEGGDDFHGRKIQRLPAEQIWDSLITLAGGDPDREPARPLDDRVYLGGVPVLEGKRTMPQISKEVLALKSETEVRAYFAKLLEEIRRASQSGGDGMMMMRLARNRDASALVRASELPSPAPRDHLLYLFGASDREVVDAASREPNVGQVLSLMNGFVQDRLVNNPDAHLYQCLEGAGSDQERIRRLHIAILSRPPDQEEMGWMLEEIKARGPEEGCRNIVSALVMSSEFLFLQ